MQAAEYAENLVLGRRRLAQGRKSRAKDLVEAAHAVHATHESVGRRGDALALSGGGILQNVPAPAAIGVGVEAGVAFVAGIRRL